MMQTAVETIQPNYMEKFKCIGDACEDSCCAGWRVVFDKRTAQAYLAAQDQGIREIAQRSIKKIKTHRSSLNHSFIQMDPQTGGCPFLEPSKLCMIQRKMGEAALSQVCSTYPRHTVTLSGQKYVVATLSCPEASRLCLLDRNSMRLGPKKIFSADTIFPEVKTTKMSPIQYLHQTAIEILEDDRMSLIEFVLVYGSALTIIGKSPELAFTESKRFAEMQNIISLVQKSLADPKANALLSSEAVHFQIGKILPMLVNHARSNARRNKRFTQSVWDALQGLKINNADLSQSVEIYKGTILDLSSNDRAKLMSGYRNYMINDLLKNVLQYNKSASEALRCLQAAITRLSLITVQIIGARSLKPDCQIEERLPFAVSSTARAFEHDPAIMDEIANYLNKIEDKSIAVLGLITPRL